MAFTAAGSTAPEAWVRSAAKCTNVGEVVVFAKSPETVGTAITFAMPTVAEHLMISLSYCYQRCAHARQLAIHQHPIPPESLPDGAMFTPSAWRRFRLMREPIQLVLDFDEDRALFVQAE